MTPRGGAMRHDSSAVGFGTCTTTTSARLRWMRHGNPGAAGAPWSRPHSPASVTRVPSRSTTRVRGPPLHVSASTSAHAR